MRVYNRLEVRLLLPKPFSIAELLETVRVVLCATDSARAQLEPLPDWRKASRRLMVYGGDDSTSRSRVQLTIDYPDTLRRFLPAPTSARGLCLCRAQRTSDSQTSQMG
jgi:DNA-binding response OmpR family regulator